MMPCTISVYEKLDGNVYIAHVNAKLMDSLYGDTIAEVVGGSVADEQNRFLALTLV